MTTLFGDEVLESEELQAVDRGGGDLVPARVDDAIRDAKAILLALEGSGEQRVRAERCGRRDEVGILLGGLDGGPGRHDLKARDVGEARADRFDHPHSPELAVRRARQIAKGKNRELAVRVATARLSAGR